MRFLKRNGRPRTPWVIRLSTRFPWVSINSSLIFIAAMVVVIGVAALLGISDPQTITQYTTQPAYRVWGGTLAITGSLLLVAIIRRDILLEKFSARVLGMLLGGFGLWALVANGIERSLVTVSLITIIVMLLEQRISLVNVLLGAQGSVAHYEIKKREDE